jgi:REP element-mobilizing transposase RayT
MPQSLSVVYLHLVFSTKDRRPFLKDAELRTEMHSYLGGVSKRLGCPPLAVGGTADHVHVLARMGRLVSQAEWVKEVKRVSSAWVKQRERSSSRFSWQLGYGLFSVSASKVKSVMDYVGRQDAHHRKRSFQDEYRALLRKHGIGWDERHVWG